MSESPRFLHFPMLTFRVASGFKFIQEALDWSKWTNLKVKTWNGRARVQFLLYTRFWLSCHGSSLVRSMTRDAGDQGSNSAIMMGRQRSRNYPIHHPHYAFTTKKLSTGANGQKEDEASSGCFCARSARGTRVASRSWLHAWLGLDDYAKINSPSHGPNWRIPFTVTVATKIKYSIVLFFIILKLLMATSTVARPWCQRWMTFFVFSDTRYVVFLRFISCTFFFFWSEVSAAEASRYSKYTAWIYFQDKLSVKTSVSIYIWIYLLWGTGFWTYRDVSHKSNYSMLKKIVFT